MKEYGMGGSKPKKKVSSLSKVKVSDKVIGQIKTLGMTKALASAKSNRNNPTYIAGLKRMYGAKRVSDALGYKAGAGKARPVGGVMGSSKYKNVMGGSSTSKVKSNVVMIDGRKYTPAAAAKLRKERAAKKK
jgi:hypothetical protein